MIGQTDPDGATGTSNSRVRSPTGPLLKSVAQLRSGNLVLGLFLIGVVAFAALFADVIAPYRPTATDPRSVMQAPSAIHLLGTDNYGRDILSRLIFGARVAFQVAILSVFIGSLIGTSIGLVSGYFAGRVEAVSMFAMDVLWSFPGLVLALLVVAALGPGINSVMVAVGILFIPIFARVARASTISVSKNSYIEAAVAVGMSDLRVILTEILPNVVSPIVVQVTLAMGYAVLIEAALSYIGLGAQAPAPAWGLMLNDARDFMARAPWALAAPCIPIFLTVLGFNLIGDGLRDLLDPRFRRVVA
jgi:peptide/nickel transport system permease protein